ncbi:MAG: CbiX/SirB N-terminal domain-containing protein [Candidatus Thiodiazotropha endolucinida]|uniref:CbiX n=1 Tax=Candidatus Thiodiazotropha endolucinida TaxID=1655433 RepID=A0A7Z0VI81_9GAMM|nr:CbiX/SirB N-terminal domain-containing protein [Candidatus Thiodiazotropha endolucinida]ODJ86063.1 CbiX [Candidatus Thiodiazotropha endolucinida]
MKKPLILLLDNGSIQPQATRNLRKLAAELSRLSQYRVYPVSLQQADRIAPGELDGIPAQLLESFLSAQLERGIRDYLAIPLFFGVSRALTSFIPNLVESLQSIHGPFRLHIADVLYPLPRGEPRLIKILKDQIDPLISGSTQPRVILVDHGSPLPEVTEVRLRIARELSSLLPPDAQLSEAVMERRKGSEYDFNGERLDQVLQREAQRTLQTPIALSLLFLSPGRHAGEGGDIATICGDIERLHPGLDIRISPLVGEHPHLIEVLLDRLRSGLRALD